MFSVDMLSDSGIAAMSNQQWFVMFLADESYGSNKGHYVRLDNFSDIFEREDEKNWKKKIDLVWPDYTN